MADTAVLKSNNGTIGSFAQAHTEAETTTNNATETTSENNNAVVETGDSSVNTNGEIVNNDAAATTTATGETATTPEANESTFSLGFDEETTTASAAAETAQTTQPQEINIDEVLKKFDKKEVAKKLGLSDFALEIDEHLARGGSPVDYLNAKAINWDNVSDIDILKADFTKKYAMLDPDSQDYLFQKKYGINPDIDDEETKREKAINIKIDAAQLRNDKKAEQAKFKLPEAKTQTEQSQEYVEWQQSVQRQQQETQKAQQYISNHPSIQTLTQSKRVAIELGEGVKPFNFNIDKPELMTKAILDGSFYRKLITNQQGELDVDKIIRITKYAFNPDKHDKDLFNYGQSHGLQKIVSEGQNAKKPDGVSASPEANNGVPKITGTGKLGNHIRR